MIYQTRNEETNVEVTVRDLSLDDGTQIFDTFTTVYKGGDPTTYTPARHIVDTSLRNVLEWFVSECVHHSTSLDFDVMEAMFGEYKFNRDKDEHDITTVWVEDL